MAAPHPGRLDIWWRHKATDPCLHAILEAYRRNGEPAVRLVRDGWGKLRAADQALSFSLSHGEAFSVYVVADGAEVGVDCEAVRPHPDLGMVAELCFCAIERACLARAAARDFLPLFYALWTRKEALAKALGLGLSGSLASFDATSDDFRRPSPVTVPAHGTYWLTSIPAPPGYAAACASRHPFTTTNRTPDGLVGPPGFPSW